jgi:hypothetical protein
MWEAQVRKQSEAGLGKKCVILSTVLKYQGENLLDYQFSLKKNMNAGGEK